ncbi:MAG: hypothetical protein A2W33_02080 [Chloroflexi bacterium RBG_16_52_11]|nr:MAG: hypothetical protein A2W33_02080 [Chloroflexi bacterium RBG_16_52_11]
MSEPLVSIIIVNWNGVKFLKDCLESVRAQKRNGLEVIFVDNGSTDGSADFVKKNFPEVVMVEKSENTGFAAGNNSGINIAKGKYILTLNNDTVAEKDFIERLVAAAEASGEKTGMWAPKILSMARPDIIDSAGGLLVSKDCLAKGRGRNETDAGQYDANGEAFIPSACAALYRKKMLDEIGLFDEDFFAYCEDTDLGLRARLFGWETVSVPSAVIYHYYSGTTGRYAPLKAYLVERNRLWVAIKNLPLSMLLISPFYTLARYFTQFYGVISGKGAGGKAKEEYSVWSLFSSVVRAYYDGIKKLPVMFSKRKAVQSKRAVSVRDVKKWFSRYGISVTEIALKD